MIQDLLSTSFPTNPEAMIAFAQRLLEAAFTASEADTIAIYIYVDALGSLAGRLVEGYREAEEDFRSNATWLSAAISLNDLSPQPERFAQLLPKHKEACGQERTAWEDAVTQIERCLSQISNIADGRPILIPNRHEVPL